MSEIKLEITETGASNLKEEPTTFNKINAVFDSIDELKEYLIERYGKMPSGKRKVYTGKEPKIIGFRHSFWNQDISHMTPKWYQTDWVVFYTVEKQYSIDINSVLN